MEKRHWNEDNIRCASLAKEGRKPQVRVTKAGISLTENPGWFNLNWLDLELREPYAVKVARTVPRGEGGRKPADLLSKAKVDTQNSTFYALDKYYIINNFLPKQTNTNMMEQALQFLREHKDVAFATCHEGRPQIRVFQVMLIEGTTLFFATAARKEVYKQLQVNPNVEILGMADNISVRIAGKVKFDVEDSIQQRIYNENAILQRLYPTYKDMEYFRMPISWCDYYDLTPTPPLLRHMELEVND